MKNAGKKISCCVALCLLVTGFVAVDVAGVDRHEPVTSTSFTEQKQIAAKIERTIVRIKTESPSTSFIWGGSGKTIGYGTGFILEKKAGRIRIATNRHVIQGCSRIWAQVARNGIVKESIECTIEKSSTQDQDFAIVTCREPKMATSEVVFSKTDISTSDPVLAAGFCFGDCLCVTVGVVVGTPGEKTFKSNARHFQGMSGGPVFNQHMKLCGIVTWEQVTPPRNGISQRVQWFLNEK